MRTLLLACCLCGLAAAEPSATATPAAPATAAKPSYAAVPCTVRGGLPNLAAKLKAGRPVTVVVIGGSITQGGGPNGYVSQLGEWLKRTWPAAKATVVNAGIGGTGSDFGAKRFDRDVLARKPDAVLIEFCVNDGERDRTQDMERMIHKTWLADPGTDIAIFYTLHQTHLAAYREGRMPLAAAFHERVAEFYGLPSFSPAFAVAQRVNGGALPWGDFSKDACHPSKDGYALFNQVFAEVMPALLAAGTPAPHALGRSLTPGLAAYPPAAVARPMAIEPLVTAAGARATATYQAPLPGVHWVGEPEFRSDEGRTLWRMSWLPLDQGGKLDAAIGADRSTWENRLATWFEEDRSFTGPAGVALLRCTDGRNLAFGAAKGQLGVLRFVAPASGRWAVQLKASRLSMWQNDDRTVALSLLQAGWDGKPGRPVLHCAASKKDFLAKGSPGFAEEREVRLMAGEELALIADTNAPGYLAWSFDDLVLKVGLLGE